jgi:hypothetical protein
MKDCEGLWPRSKLYLYDSKSTKTEFPAMLAARRFGVLQDTIPTNKRHASEVPAKQGQGGGIPHP